MRISLVFKKQFVFTPWSILLFASMAMLTSPLQAQPWVVGNAESAEDGELLYKELHYRSDPQAAVSERVEYVDSAGELLVQKSLEVVVSPVTPNVEQRDLRTGTQFSVTDVGTGLEVHYQRGGERGETQRIDKGERLVVDAGFDPYVRSHWEALSAGEAIQADFFVPARLDTVKISIRKTDAQQCQSVATSALCLVVRPAGILRLVGWLVDPLYLAYEQGSKRLLMYRGISNLLDAEGESQDVLIRYVYSNSAH